MGASLNNLGVAHKSIGDFSKALAFFTKSLTIKLATGVAPGGQLEQHC